MKSIAFGFTAGAVITWAGTSFFVEPIKFLALGLLIGIAHLLTEGQP